MEEIFKNETNITKNRLKMMMLYKKIYEKKLEYIIKILLCLITLRLIWSFDFLIEDRIFCSSIIVLGILDIFRIDQRVTNKFYRLKYIFFEDRIQIYNEECDLKLNYIDIRQLMITNNYYFLTT